MQDLLSWLVGAGAIDTVLILLIFARVGGLFLASPVIGGSYVPMQVRALVALVLALALWPATDAAALPVDISAMGIVESLVIELVIGVVMGFSLEIYFQAVRFAGDIIGRSAGFAAAEYFDPATEVMTGPVGDLFHIGVVTLFFVVDGHHWWIMALQQSYLVIPLGGTLEVAHFGAVAGHLADDFFRIGAALSLPILVAILALSVVDGVIARAVPQINILQISFIVRILVTVVLLIGSVPAIVAFLAQVLAMAEMTGQGVLRVLGA